MNNTTLQSAIFKKFILVAIVPLLLFSLIFVFIIHSEKKASLLQKHLSIISSVEYYLKEFDNNVYDIEKIIKDNHSHNEKELFNDILHLKKELNSVIVLNKDGIVQLAVSSHNTALFKGYDYSSKKVFKQFKTVNKSFFSDIYFSSSTNEPLISYIFSQNDKIYILELNMNFFTHFITDLVNQYHNINSDIYVVDRNGLFIVDSTKNNIKQSLYNTPLYNQSIKSNKQNSLIEYYNKKSKEDNFVTYSIQKHTKMFIIIKQKHGTIDPYFLHLSIVIAFVVLLISLISLFIINKMTKSIILPIRYIVNELTSLATKKITNDTHLPQIRYEIFTDLVNTFFDMKNKIIQREAQLKQLNEHLEEEVDSKTEELRQLNNNLELKIEKAVKENSKKDKLIFEQSKMASMGEMIGNIAHQWRQPLSVISTASTGMKMQKEFDLLEDEDFMKNCDMINDNAQYLSKTIDDFRDFARGDTEITLFELSNTIKSFLHIVEGAIKNNDIEIIENLDDTITLSGYPNELAQCFINIFNNSKDVFKEKEVDERLFFISTHRENQKIIITFKDNAGGIPQNILPKIFEPYFTTKHKSQGTGLGLHMSYKLITEGMDGSITANNSTYQYKEKKYTGAVFTITVPAIKNEIKTT